MIRPSLKLLIPSDFSFAKYHPGEAMLPYEATNRKLGDEILRRMPDVDVVVASSVDETEAALGDAEALVSYGVRRAMLDRAPHLRWIQAGSAGIDHFLKTSDITLAEMRQRGIRLTKAAGVTRLVIGEHVFAMLLAMSRDIPRSVRQQDARVWQIHRGREIAGSTLGIVGLGEIGGRVAELGRAFGMRVIGTKGDPSTYEGAADAVYPPDKLDEVLRAADFLVLACSLTSRTRGLINARTLGQMKRDAVLINVARGEIVVQDDLVAALRSGAIAGAALDTFGVPGRDALADLEALDATSPLWDMPNVLITPNNASATSRIYEHLADIVTDNAHRLIEGRPLQHEVVNDHHV
jgi:phosphoglycerate dehydrogenase-like enzyme